MTWAAPPPMAEYTAEGWLVITVDNAEFVKRFCGVFDPQIVGCAGTNDKLHPDPWCVIMILRHPEQTHAQHSYESVLAHERRHCIEGMFHP